MLPSLASISLLVILGVVPENCFGVNQGERRMSSGKYSRDWRTPSETGWSASSSHEDVVGDGSDEEPEEEPDVEWLESIEPEREVDWEGEIDLSDEYRPWAGEYSSSGVSWPLSVRSFGAGRREGPFWESVRRWKGE